MTITYITGDATRPPSPGKYLLAHIANDVGAWGKGYVMELTRRFGMYPRERYLDWHKTPPEAYKALDTLLREASATLDDKRAPADAVTFAMLDKLLERLNADERPSTLLIPINRDFVDARTGPCALGEVQFVTVGLPEGQQDDIGVRHVAVIHARNVGTTGTTRWADGRTTRTATSIVIATMVAQRDIKRNALGHPPLRYDALAVCLRKVKAWIGHQPDEVERCHKCGELSPIRMYLAIGARCPLCGAEARGLIYRREVHVPRIGTGLAGGTWEHIEPILKRELADVRVVVYDQLPPGHGPRAHR